MSDHTDYTSRYAIDPQAAAAMATDELRSNFHIADLFQPGRVSLTYTHYDRMIVGGAMPAGGPLELAAIKPTGTKNFPSRPCSVRSGRNTVMMINIPEVTGTATSRTAR